MEENLNKLSSKKIRLSSSSISINSQNSQSKFVFLINHLSSDIKKFYSSIKQCLDDGKQNIFQNKNLSLNTFELIDKYLIEFILKAKEIFKRMKYMQKINLIQQELNSNQNSNQNLNINLFNQNNNNNYLNSYHDNKKLIDDDVYIPSLCNNTSTSFHINKFFKKINIEKKNKLKEKQDMIKSLNNSSKDIKLIKKYDSTFSHDASRKKNNHSANKLIYNNYNHQYNNLKRNNKKSVINLRKKIIFDKKPESSSLGLSNSNGLNNFNSNNISMSDVYLSKKEIYNNLNVIISLLKEMKLNKGNIFTKSMEAEKHKKILNQIYNELIKLIKNIFKDSNINNNSLELFNKEEKSKNNSNSNLIYYKTSNNINNNNNNENNNNKNMYYKKEIKYRDLIIQQLKEELNTKSQKINSNKEENINKNKSKKIINELQEKIEQNQKKNYNQINKDKNLELMKKCFQLQQEKDILLSKNEELENKIILLNQELDIAKKNTIITPLYRNLITQNFNFNYPSLNDISEKAQKIIDELNTKINNYNEQNNKNTDEINKLNEEINKNKEEIIQLNNDINKYKEELAQLNLKYNENINETKTLKENIENLNNNIEKYKKLLSYQEEELKNMKNEAQLHSKNEQDLLNKSLPIKDSLNNNSQNNNNNIINTDEKKNKKRNISKINEYQIEQDKIYLKYELLKNDYDKLNSTLMQKQKLLDNYSKISSETASKTNIDEQILELMAQHKKEIEALTEKYNKNILSLKMNMPSPFSPATHTILIDKRYAKYDLKWYLLTVLTEQEKNYENTFWVSDLEMRPILEQFNLFKTEKELEDEKFDNLYKMQDKWIKQLDEKEKIIENLKEKLDYYENNQDNEK